MLSHLGFKLEVVPPDCDEKVLDHLPIHKRVQELAALKVKESAKKAAYPPRYALGADTLVSSGSETFGKPGNIEEARAMLLSLSGRDHLVSTGLAVLDRKSAKLITAINETRVWFKSIDKPLLEFYLNTGEWQGVAGAYRIQDTASFFVEKIEGSFSCIVGLPIHTFYDILLQIGYSFPFGNGFSFENQA